MKKILLIAVVILIFYFFFSSNDNDSKTDYEIAEQYIEEFQPEKAIPYLRKIEKDDPNYENAQEVLRTIGNLYELEAENTKTSNETQIKISENSKKELKKFQNSWAKEQLKFWETFLVDYELIDLENINFILSKEASEHGSLDGHTNSVVPSLKSRYKESLEKAKLPDYPINISIKRMTGTSNNNLITSESGWLPTEYLWYNVTLYFGEGIEKRLIGTVVKGELIDDIKYVVIKTKSGAIERKTLDHIKKASYYIKADDPNVKKRVLKYN